MELKKKRKITKTIILDESQDKVLKKIAEENGISQSELIRKVLSNFFSKYGQTSIKN